MHAPMVALLRQLHPDEGEFLQLVLEILADVVDPLEENTKSPTSPHEDEEEHPDEVFARALSIVEEILRFTSKESSHPGIRGLLQNYIIPSLNHMDASVREKALSCLALFCLLDEQEAAKYLLVFVKVVGSAEPDGVQHVAVRALFDFLTLFGPETLLAQERLWGQEFQIEENEKDKDEQDNRSFTMMTLVRCLTQTRNLDIRSTAVEGFAKLLLNNFLDDCQIVSVLITLYFHPKTHTDQLLTQCLGAFFPAYCMNSPLHAAAVRDAFSPTLERIIGCSEYSPLRKVDIGKVVQFMISHIDMEYANRAGKTIPSQDELALVIATLANEYMDNNTDMSKALCKVLHNLRIEGEEEETAKSLARKVELLLEDVSEKSLKSNLNKVLTKLGHSAGRKRARKTSSSPSKRRRTTSPVVPRQPPKRKRALSLKQDESPTKKYKPTPRPTAEVIALDKEESGSASEKEEEENQEEEVEEEQAPSKKVVIAFSGFSISESTYNMTLLQSLVKKARALHAEIRLGNIVDTSITHIVSPANLRTIKTVVGSLMNRWIVTPEWLVKSASEGKFVREELYGGKSSGNPFAGKKIHITSQFLKENPNAKQFPPDLLRQLVTEAGGGKIVETKRGVDYIFCAKAEVPTRKAKNTSYLTWKDFFELLQPTVNII